MPLTLRNLDARTDPAARDLIDAVFERAGQESVLARRIAEDLEAYDPGLALAARDGDSDVGWALFLPRQFRLRDTWVRLAVSAPFGVLPEARRRGVGRFLLAAGRQGLLDRGLRGAVVLGGAEFFAQSGYQPAFNLYTTTVHGSQLPEGPEPHTWRALQAADIPVLRELHERNYATTNGTERRSDSPADWESSGHNCYTLVLERADGVAGFLRFRVRERLEVSECAARDGDAIEALRRVMRRLIAEHGRTQIEVHLPPPHPVARALFHRGCSQEVNNFGGAALLGIADWRGLFADTHESWARALRAAGGAPCSLDLEGQVLRLELAGDTLELGEGVVEGRHLWVPPALAPGLVTGQRCHLDLAEEPEVRARSQFDGGLEELLPRLFPGDAAMWTYAPLYELADD